MITNARGKSLVVIYLWVVQDKELNNVQSWRYRVDRVRWMGLFQLIKERKQIQMILEADPH